MPVFSLNTRLKCIQRAKAKGKGLKTLGCGRSENLFEMKRSNGLVASHVPMIVKNATFSLHA